MVIHRLRCAMISIAALLGVLATCHAWAQGFPGGPRDTLGPGFGAGSQPRPAQSDAAKHHGGGGTLLRLRYWNSVAIDASGLDHTPVAPGETRVFGEQLGPGARAARWRSCTSRCSTR